MPSSRDAKYRRYQDPSHVSHVVMNWIGGVFWVSVCAVMIWWGWHWPDGPPSPAETFPYGPTPTVQLAKREHGVVSGRTIKFDQDFMRDPDAFETALYVGEGWDTVLSWDGPRGSRGALNYDGSITFTNDDGLNELHGLFIQSLEGDTGHR